MSEYNIGGISDGDGWDTRQLDLLTCLCGVYDAGTPERDEGGMWPEARKLAEGLEERRVYREARQALLIFEQIVALTRLRGRYVGSGEALPGGPDGPSLES